jgi:hypothetical protein
MAIEVVSTFLMVAVFLFSVCLVTLFSRVYPAYLFLSVLWVGGGFFALMVSGTGWNFWPDWMFASGISNIIGGTIGFVLAKIIRRWKKR